MAYFEGLEPKLTPDKIVSKLIYFRDMAHMIHFNTKSYETHKNFDGIYSALDEWVDKIGELILGYIAPNRLKLETIKPTANQSPESFLDELCEFADDLYEYSEKMEWWALSNMAADLSADGYKGKYLLTLT